MTHRLLVTGAGGQLAGAIVAEFERGFDVRPLRHGELDITDHRAVDSAVAAYRPTVILNCAAYNLVDRAEEEPEAALNANAYGVRVLARAAAESGAMLIHYSTDFVFDGRASRPYTEEDPPNPVSVYGSSKLLGEWFALEVPRGYVLRVASLFGGEPAKSSVDRIINALLERREARVFTDRTATPSYVVDVASATRVLIERDRPGLYHCVGSNVCTWHELGVEAARLLGVDHARYVVPVSSDSISMPAARPKYAGLSNQKLRAFFPMPSWQDALARYVTQVLQRRAAQPSRQ